MRVLFICVGNSCRSQIAEAFVRIHGVGRIEAYSAGSNPSGIVNPKAIEVMREVGYNLRNHRSKSLKDIPDVEYDLAITMGCGDKCPFVRAKRNYDWGIPDPKAISSDEFRSIRNLIEKKVIELLSNL